MSNRRTIADPKNLHLGSGELFFNGEFVGTLQGSVNFQRTRSFAEQRAGDSLLPSKAYVTMEDCVLTAEVAELKLENLKKAFGSLATIESAPQVMKRTEFITLVGTDPTTLGETPVVGSIKVYSNTRETEYVVTTDYTISGADITRSVGSSIPDGGTVLVEYNVSDATARKLTIGGSCDLPSYQLDFIEHECGSDPVQITIFKAYANTDLEMAFNSRESGDFLFHTISFKGLRDTTKAPGKQLCDVIIGTAS